MSVDVPRPDHAPQLSVVVPCFNEAKNLPELVLRTRTRRGGGITFEVVLVDDGSTDDTWAVMEAATEHGRRSSGSSTPRTRGCRRLAERHRGRARGRCVPHRRRPAESAGGRLAALGRAAHRRTDLVQGYRCSIDRERDSRYSPRVGLNTLLNRPSATRARQQVRLRHRRREILEDVLRHRSATTTSRRSSGWPRSQGLQRPRDRDHLPAPSGRESFIDGCPVKVRHVLSDLAERVGEFGLGRRNPESTLRLPAAIIPATATPGRAARSMELLRHDAAPRVDDPPRARTTTAS